MKLLFNKDDAGKTEIKNILGFLEGGFNYENLEPDIILTTPYLIDLVSQAVYDKVETHYDSGNEDENLDLALKYMQLYILSMAYLDYAPDNDLNHGVSGRSFRSEDNEKIPWEWQIEKSNSSIKKRAYKALDQLFALLDKLAWAEWTASDPYKASKALFIQNTAAFDAVYPINKSGQLYYRLVPFMKDFEVDKVAPILTNTVTDTLRNKTTPSATEKELINLIRKAVAYLSLGKAYKVFPIEMMPESILYNEDTKMKSEARAEVMQFLTNEGEKYLLKLEYEYSRQNATYEAIDPLQGLQAGTKHVSL